MAETQVLGWGTQTAPATRTTKASEQFELLSIEADFDGTAAAGSWIPAVQVISDAGQSVGVYTADDTLTTGDTATVTFAPFLGKKGGIRFGKVNTGNWLEVDTTTTGPQGVGIALLTSNGMYLSNAAGPFLLEDFGTGMRLSSFGGDLNLESGVHDIILTSTGGQITITGPGAASIGVDGTQVNLQQQVIIPLGAGAKVEVRDSSNNPIFRVNENGDLQGKTGKALTFNL